MSGRLSGKIALITGGTSGIGLASAKLFASEGARVAVCGRSQETINQVQAELGEGHLGIQCDVSKIEDIERMAALVERTFGQIDIVFANAGIAKFKAFADWTVDDFDELFSINARGQFFTAQKMAPLVKPGGVIILTGSVAASKGQTNIALYGASKAVTPALAKMLSAELLDQKVRVLCLTPGPVETPIFEKAGLPQDRFGEVAAKVPLGRVGTPEELAAAALFLASDDSSFMLGTEVIVDGGKVVI